MSKHDRNTSQSPLHASGGEGITTRVQDPWGKLSPTRESQEEIVGESRSFGADVRYRFFRRKSAVFGIVMIILFLIFAFVGPFLTPYSYETQKRDFANIGPILHVTPVDGRNFLITSTLQLIETTDDGLLLHKMNRGKEDFVAKTQDFYLSEEKDEAAIITLHYGERPMHLTYDGEEYSETRTLWNRGFPLGTDQLGRDMMTRLMFGTRVSLVVALVATFVNMTIGIIYGGISGFVGGTTDLVMMRIVDIISTIPLTLYVILIMVVLKSGFLSIIIALSSVYWVGMARVVRGQVWQLKENDFVLAAYTIGSSNRTILSKHLIPNAMGPILVTATMQIPAAIFMEAFMSFIGLGIPAPMASLGTMCNDAVQTLRQTPYQLFLPSLAICLIMFAFNFVGDGLRDAIDPKMKK